MKKTALAAVFASIVFINFTASLFAEDKARRTEKPPSDF